MSHSVYVSIEVRLKSTCTKRHNEVALQVLSYLERRGMTYYSGPQDFADDPAFGGNVEAIRIAEFDSGVMSVPFFAAATNVVVYQCSEEGPSSERAGGGGGGAEEGDVMSNYSAVRVSKGRYPRHMVHFSHDCFPPAVGPPCARFRGTLGVTCVRRIAQGITPVLRVIGAAFFRPRRRPASHRLEPRGVAPWPAW